MTKKRKKFSLLLEVLILFVIGVLVTGIITFISQRKLSVAGIRQQTETLASEIAGEVALSIREYPAYEWLLEYWYAHSGEMDIEYDVEYDTGTVTEEKCQNLSKHYPGIQMKYATTQQIQAMQPEEQKLYAEIVYSWLITRINQIKRIYHVDYLFCVLTDESYESQFFLLSAAQPGAVRGENYEEVYPLGTTTTVAKSQQRAMKNAKSYSSHLADAGDYVDYYVYFGETKGYPVFVGMTYNLSDIKSAVESQTLLETVYAMLYQIILSLICLLLVYQFVIKPLGTVQKNIRLYKQTKDSKAVTSNLRKIKIHNEIGELSEDVSDLAKEIDNYINRIGTITAEKERISTELSLATRIQAGMLPDTYPAFPDRNEFDIYATMDPAKEVGGDFYDYFLIDDDHLCMVMADVSGKGVPAALFMMASKIILANNAMTGKSPAEILTDTNSAICSNNREEMFVTVWLGILEISTGRLTAANAGHEYPVLKQRDGSFELFRDKHGFVIGGMDGMKYKEYELNLEPGAKLFLYTDGVPEATDAGNNMFGMDRLLEALNEEPDAASEVVLENVRKAVDGFVKDAEQFDDLTMLCMEYRGEEL